MNIEQSQSISVETTEEALKNDPEPDSRSSNIHPPIKDSSLNISSSDNASQNANALVVVDTPELKSDTHQQSLFSRFLARIGLRTNGSLREELTDALSNEGQDSTVFSPEERSMLHNILRLKEVRVEDVMVPRTDIIAVEDTTPLSELLQIFEDSAHSRMPIFSDTLDDPKGMVHIRDVVSYLTNRSITRKSRSGFSKLDLERVNLKKTIKELKLIRPVLFVPPSMLVNTLMSRMQAERIQMALVIDEYGGTDGIVSLEDIVEEVVGEIEDEHDDEDGPLISKSANDRYIADARADLKEVQAVIGDNFNAGDVAEDVDTIGGLVFAIAGRIPVRGEVIEGLSNFEFRIIDADPRRIKKLEIVEKRIIDRRRKPIKNTDNDEKASD
jgi:CBS domain containing-hemolysin-like protein